MRPDLAADSRLPRPLSDQARERIIALLRDNAVPGENRRDLLNVLVSEYKERMLSEDADSSAVCAEAVAVLDPLVRDRDSSIAQKAISSLKETVIDIAQEDSLACPILLEALGDEREDVRACAVNAVHWLRHRPIDELVRLLESKNSYQRQAALLCLQGMGGEATKHLVEQLENLKSQRAG